MTARKVMTTTLVLLICSTSASGLTPLSVQTRIEQTEAGVLERLQSPNALLPSCKIPFNLKLSFEGSVNGVSAAKVSGSLEIIPGPTIGVAGQQKVMNLLQKFAGTLTTGVGSRTITWAVTQLNGGVFAARTSFSEDRLSFILPGRFDRVENDEGPDLRQRPQSLGSSGSQRPVFAILAVTCFMAQDKGLVCEQAHFIFDRKFPELFGSTSSSEKLFHGEQQSAIREAAREYEHSLTNTMKRSAGSGASLKVNSNDSLLDCCITNAAGSNWCTCKCCNFTECPEPEDCPSSCENCFVDLCMDCMFLDCFFC
jgi:hypothetical protein